MRVKIKFGVCNVVYYQIRRQKMIYKLLLSLYILILFFQSVRFQPSKNKIHRSDSEESETCLKKCLSGCFYTWGFCSNAGTFLGPIIEYTGIYLEDHGRINRTSLSYFGTLEGIAAATAIICRHKQDKIDADCRIDCEIICGEKISLNQNNVFFSA